MTNTGFVLRGILVGGLAASLPSVVGAQQRLAPVVVSKVVQRKVEAGQTFVGTVMPLKKSAVGSAVDGRVIEFPINEGDRVRKGQTLAQLRTETLEIQLTGAEAELKLRQEELAELKNGSRPEEIEQAQARMKSAEAQRDFTKAKYERWRSLLERAQSGAVTEEQVEEAHAAAVSAEQSYLESKAAYELAVQGPRQEKIAQAEARLAVQQEVVNGLKDQIQKHTIVSPFDGYVVAEHTEVGQWVDKGDLVADVIYLDEVDVEAHVLEQHAAHLRVGHSARVEVPALPNDAFTGNVVLVVPQADVRSRTIPVKVRLQNTTEEGVPLLKAGMLARVTLPTGAPEVALLVPKDALVLGGPRPTVFVVEPTLTPGRTAGEGGKQKDEGAGSVRPVPVELGVASGSLIQVKADLKPGELVVVQGNERLRPGQQVKIAEVLPPEVEEADRVARPESAKGVGGR